MASHAVAFYSSIPSIPRDSPVRRNLVLVMGLMLALSVAESQSTRPSHDSVEFRDARDLSGIWKLNSEKSDLRAWAKTTPQRVAIRQSDKRIQFDQAIGGKHVSVSYPMDGSEEIVSRFDHHEKAARAHWSKGVLVVEERVIVRSMDAREVEDQEMTRTRWLLSDDGKVLTLKNAERATTAVFDRQE